jgi:hypothetical protein
MKEERIVNIALIRIKMVRIVPMNTIIIPICQIMIGMMELLQLSPLVPQKEL